MVVKNGQCGDFPWKKKIKEYIGSIPPHERDFNKMQNYDYLISTFNSYGIGFYGDVKEFTQDMLSKYICYEEVLSYGVVGLLTAVHIIDDVELIYDYPSRLKRHITHMKPLCLDDEKFDRFFNNLEDKKDTIGLYSTALRRAFVRKSDNRVEVVRTMFHEQTHYLQHMFLDDTLRRFRMYAREKDNDYLVSIEDVLDCEAELYSSILLNEIWYTDNEKEISTLKKELKDLYGRIQQCNIDF